MAKIYQSENPLAVAESFADWFFQWVDSLPVERKTVNVALSGGSTPRLLFELWATKYGTSFDWSRIHFFWGDERCVSPDDSESNFGTCKRLFLDHIDIPDENIHRIRGEADPHHEAVRYGKDLCEHLVKNEAGWPNFDLIILGMGSDGHTASIFADRIELFQSDKVCEVAIHPDSGQHRVTLTGEVLNAADKVTFLIVGESKREILRMITNRRCGFEVFPAGLVDPAGELLFFVDNAAVD